MGCLSIFLVLSLLCFTFNHFTQAKHDAEPTAANKKLPFPSSRPSAAIVVGTVYCDTCFQDAFSKDTRFISGASVAVECRRRRFQQQVKTDEQGRFKVKLPFSVSKQVDSIRRCSVKLVSSSDPSCAVASIANSSALHRIHKKQGDLHVFSAGFFTFRPSQHTNLCSQKDLSGLPTLPSPSPVNEDDPSHSPDMNQNRFLPPLPLLPRLPPLPPLPPLPTLPRMPFLPPWPAKTKASGKPHFRKGDDELSDQKSGQNPHQPQGFLPMPPILPPNPLLPSPPLIPNPFQPPPSVLPPILPQPPPAPLLPIPPLPPLPGLFTPPPPPPAFRFPPFPPLLPFPPGFPGIPPRASDRSGP
ncbi:IgA FC receptor [Linum perenne]